MCVQEELHLVDKGALSMLQKIRNRAVRTVSSVTEQLRSGEWLSERIVSLILSFIYCGLGQIYKRETSKGVCFVIVYTTLIVLLFFFSFSSFVYLFVLSALILMWLIGMIDAYVDDEALMKRERWMFWRSLLAVVRFSGIFASAVALVLVASVSFENENDVRNDTRIMEQPDSSGVFYIQVAAFKDSENAKEYCHELLSNGHQARIESPVAEGGFHRVLVGEFFNDQDAISFAEKLYEQERFPYMIIRRRTSEKAELFQTQPCMEIVDGIARVSLDSIGKQEGIASCYSDTFHGRLTASGEIYDMNQLTAAHSILSFGTFARVTDIENGKVATVRINDRIPQSQEIIINLSRRAAKELGILSKGEAWVTIELASPDTQAQ